MVPPTGNSEYSFSLQCLFHLFVQLHTKILQTHIKYYVCLCVFQNTLMFYLNQVVFLNLPVKPLLQDEGRGGYAKPNQLLPILCILQLSEGEVIKPAQSPENTLFPVIHRQYIYFFSSKENKETFMKNPIKYICQPKPKPPVPVKIAIVGPPKSGKTTGRRHYYL